MDRRRMDKWRVKDKRRRIKTRKRLWRDGRKEGWKDRGGKDKQVKVQKEGWTDGQREENKNENKEEKLGRWNERTEEKKKNRQMGKRMVGQMDG